jgi:transcriptional regulator of aromatic amino acid metabolism
VSQQTEAVQMKIIAAIAEDMARKMERAATWPGDVEDAKNRIYQALQQIHTK